VVCEVVDLRREGVGVLRDDAARLAVLDDVGNAADGRADDWCARGEDFEEDEPEALVVRGERVS
jgi:hypothetical protein